MKKSWKGFASSNGDVIAHLPSQKVQDLCTPVLMIDASEFPEDYPVIGSEWRYEPKRHTPINVRVETPPYQVDDGFWCVGVSNFIGRKLPYWLRIHELKPIPTKVNGEVVGTYKVRDGECRTINVYLDGPGEYDIIKRNGS